MAGKILRGTLKGKRNLFLAAAASLFLLYYIVNNWKQPAEEYYLLGNAKFLIFSTAYYLLLFFRVKFYQSASQMAILRIGNEKWIRSLMCSELIIAIVYFFLIFVLLPVLCGIGNFPRYLIALFLWGIVWILNYFIFVFFADDPGKETIGVALSLIIIVIYTYAAAPLLYSWLFE